MTRTFSILTALAIAAALVIHYAEKPINPTAPNLIPAAAESSDASANTDMPHTNPAPASPRESRPADALSHQSTAAPPPASVEAIAFAAAVDTLTSVRATHAEKQAALKQLQDSGRLADAAAELEQRKSADPQNALYPTALGQVYLRLCATTTDVRQQAIWGMTADADFETALNLDPSNWDARFTRAVAMSYWPDTLNKGPEVIQQFNTLIQQQEQQAPQPQFAQTYEWLGKQYQKTGQSGDAQQIWQRGASLFPDDQALQTLLASSPAPRQ